MTLIAALLTDQLDRNALVDATARYRVLWARDWRHLSRLVRRRPVFAAIADLHAEPGKDGALRVYRFRQRYPLTPLVVWGEVEGRDLFRIGKAGATDVIVAASTRNPTLVEEIIEASLDSNLADMVERGLDGRIADEAVPFVRRAAIGIGDGIQVSDLADSIDISVSTLERRFERWGLTTPGRLLLWLRVLYGLRWLLEPGRSIESVARQIGYSSGAAFRRAVRATLGDDAGSLREDHLFDSALDALVKECPGLAPSGDGG